MFGLVRASSLRAAEKKIEKLGADLDAAKERTWSLMADLKASEEARTYFKAESERLLGIITEHPLEPAGADPAPANETAEARQPIRMLTSLEVVERATAHRNIRNKAIQAR